MKQFIIIVSVFFLAGCTTEWIRNSPDAEDLNTAKNNCEELAEQKFPILNKIATKTHYETVQEKCSNKAKCNGNKYHDITRPVTESSVIDVNEDSREDWFMKCMEKKGWHGKPKLMF